MTPALVIWLIVTIAWPDAEPLVTETRYPDVASCIAQASRTLEHAATVRSDDPYRVHAECMIEWPGEDPA